MFGIGILAQQGEKGTDFVHYGSGLAWEGGRRIHVVMERERERDREGDGEIEVGERIEGREREREDQGKERRTGADRGGGSTPHLDLHILKPSA